MDVQYDPGADALYIDLDPSAELADTVEMNDVYLMVHVDGTGHPAGIEVLFASRGFDLQPVIDRFGLEHVRAELMEIQGREFRPDRAWKRTRTS